MCPWVALLYFVLEISFEGFDLLLDGCHGYIEGLGQWFFKPAHAITTIEPNGHTTPHPHGEGCHEAGGP